MSRKQILYMLFNSFEFLLFFPIVTILFFLLPHKFRWILLLAASCYFYMAFVPIYILILFFTIIIDYFAGILIENSDEKHRRNFLILSIVANVSVLVFFKYYNFFLENINTILSWNHSTTIIPYLKIILPIGLSFHTFQAMSYTIEVYRGNQKAERHFGIYSLYVMFYPQLVAGPIERPQNILHQFHEEKRFSYSNLMSGIKLMAWGLFKKAVIADRLAVITDPIFNNPHSYSSLSLGIGVFFFAWQIYCDFSGYSDIAIGSARILGIKLMINFDRPFASKNVTEFWRRWHISLTTWFYDYVFNPLIYNLRKYGKISIAIGLFITFFLSGFWHGAGWKFVIAGILNAMALIFEYFTKDFRSKLFGFLPKTIKSFMSKFFTLSFVSFTWIFFRANNIKDAFYITNKIGGIFSEIINSIHNRKLLKVYFKDLHFGFIVPALLLIILLEFIQFYQGRKNIIDIINKQPLVVRWLIYILFFFLLFLAGEFGKKEFIYFQF